MKNKSANELDDIFKNNSTFKPQAEMITPEGFRARVPASKTPLEKLNEPLEISISSEKANQPFVDKGDKPPYAGLRA